MLADGTLLWELGLTWNGIRTWIARSTSVTKLTLVAYRSLAARELHSVDCHEIAEATAKLGWELLGSKSTAQVSKSPGSSVGSMCVRGEVVLILVEFCGHDGAFVGECWCPWWWKVGRVLARTGVCADSARLGVRGEHQLRKGKYE